MTRVFQHKTNGKIYGLTQIVDNNAYLIDVNTDERKTITLSTLHRYYKEVEQVEQVEQQNVTKKYDWRKYYKSYKRNSLPLWDAAISTDCKLYVRDCDKNILITCQMTDTLNCICVRQHTGSKRYFTNFGRALKHILNNQDIRTIGAITPVFKKWLGLFNKSI